MSKHVLTAFLLVSAIACTVKTSAEDTQYWIYAGQSNLAGFSGLQAVVRERFPAIQLKEIRSGIPGTPIQSWLKDDPWQERDKTGWKILLDGLKKKGDGQIVGMVWYQGESNTRDDALKYEEHLTTLIANVRQLTGKPKLPVIIVQLATCRQDTWGWAMVREAQRRVALADRQAEVVCGLDLDIGDNIVHLSGASKAEIGRRQGLAALRLVYGRKDVTHGPQFSHAFLADGTKNTVVIQFEDVQGQLQLQEGWRQGLAAVESVTESAELPPLREALIWPAHAEVIPENRVALVFDRPLAEDARVGWGMTPSACIGPHRRWDMPIQGVTDETGIAAIAFALAPVKHAPTGFSLPQIRVLERTDSNAFDLTKPFQLGVNGIGRSAQGRLEPLEEAGAPGFRQKYWNGVHKGLENYLTDSRGRRTRIGVVTSCWYANFAGTADTPDQRLMGSYNSDRDSPTRIVGLLPKRTYDIVLYHNMPDRPQEVIQYSIGSPVVDGRGRAKGVDAQETVAIRQHASGARDEDRFAFVDYVECTKDNKLSGNYYVFRGIKSNEDGEIMIRPKAMHKGGRPRFTALQIIFRETEK